MANNKGFTLVELMITLAMTGIILAAVYATYIIQKKTYTAQDQVVEMQQNIRAAMFSMTRDIRMAGYNPTGDTDASIINKPANTPPILTNISRISFTMDLAGGGTANYPDGDGDLLDANENITYGFLAADDTDGNGVVDNVTGAASLRRRTGANGTGILQPIADNIQALELLYTLKDGSQTTAPATSQLQDVRNVTISILARAAKRDAKFVNNKLYIPASGMMWDLNGAAPGTGQPTNDNFRRRLLITTVQCRNMGT